MSTRKQGLSLKARDRLEQIEYAKLNGVTAACQKFGVGRTQIYEWLSRYKRDGLAGLEDIKRKPGHHPDATTDQEIALLRELQLEFPKAASERLSRRLAKKGYKRSAVTIRKLLRSGQLLSPKEVAEELQQRHRSGTPLKARQRTFIIEKNPRFKAAGKIGTKPAETICVATLSLKCAKKRGPRYVHCFFDTFSGFVFGRISEHKATLDILASLRELIGRQKLPQPDRIVWLKRPDAMNEEQENGRTVCDLDFDGFRFHFSNWARKKRQSNLKSLSRSSLDDANTLLSTVMDEYNKTKWKGFPNFEISPRKIFRGLGS